ncbi:Homocitrate synthase [Thermococcus sp. 2319x1]|uniref:homocitrate synthase n=1 Tax=Thermococcus sp. 2319x1 TaxID=1674923 RepID=UPI00073A5BBD|nr:homocitrate synthase [Thermococcus sp. 2319x1]ALV62699.1 Homocitrate synthase [Thermococcus sp. 2319x1]
MVLDSTLREGEQTPGVNFSPEDRLRIGIALDEIRVDFIEAGHPAVSEEILEGIRLLASQGLNANILAHSRALRSDIDLVLKAEAEWIGIFMCLSRRCLERRFRTDLSEALARIEDAILYAKDHGLKVRFTPEDTTRTEWENLTAALNLARELKVDRVSIADTTGVAHPLEFYDLVKRVVEFGIPVNVHCHNDLGLALANAIMGIEAGATLVDATINGIGERAGIVDLSQLLAVLYYHYGIKKYRLEKLYSLSRLVSEITELQVQQNYPIVGQNAFTHKAGLHVSAVVRDPSFYEFLPPETFGRERTIYVDRFAGKDTIRFHLCRFGIHDEGIIEELLRRVKASRRPFTPEMLAEEARRMMT